MRSFTAGDFPAARVAAAKSGRRVSVVLPARNEEATVAAVVGTIRSELMERHPVVDELVVIDDGSTDRTREVATRAGATVVPAGDVLAEHGADGGDHGKGQALWRGVAVTTGDLVVFCDADIIDFDPAFVLGLLGPLLIDETVGFVKGYYERPLHGRPGEGGRVTELMARPLIALWYPELTPVVQPLAGEYAARREILESVPFVCGYGVDLGLLVDVSRTWGAATIVQCDLGERIHRNRPLAELGPQALAVLQLGAERAGLAWSGQSSGAAVLARAGRPPVVVRFDERPALDTLPARRQSA